MSRATAPSSRVLREKAAIVNTLINTQLRVDEAKLKARQSDELLPKLLEQLKIKRERIVKIHWLTTSPECGLIPT
jgi:hypothetical protein